MITCNRCGKLTYEGLANCQNCGMPLSGKPGSGVAPKMGTPELPAWLESLRAGERPVAATGGQPNFSTSNFVDKDALPSWMRPESAESISADQHARRRASMPAPNTDAGFPPPGGIVASSLIDEQSLPSWLQENSSLSQERNISAASLVQPDALPEWMSTVPPPAPAASAMHYAEPVMPSQGISANSLIDPQAVPPWMASEHGQSGLNEFTPAAGQSGIAAASLLDLNTLPNWLHESPQEQKPLRTEMTPTAVPGQTHSTNNSLTAPSLIDVNALPEWLRAGTDMAQSGVAPAAPTARGWNVPPRVENVRVPSRPRAEMGPREQNEVAANVFASMLGVASPAPYFSPHSPGNAASPLGGQPLGSVAPGTPLGVAGPGYPAERYSISDQQPGVPQPRPVASPGMADSMETNARSGKRGILATILSWFSR